MRINITGVFVSDQRHALKFYTERLGFQVKHDVPMGEYAWLTLVSSEEPEGPEFLLEPNAHPAVEPYRTALMEDGIPLASFAVEDVQAEYDRLVAEGVRFTQPPVDHGTVVTAVFDDTCGNLVQITAETEAS